jgi:hypothetical protein
MWPWEHAAIGYVCYSAATRLVAGRAPRGDPVLALAVGTQFPDLVDKPLSWGLGVFPTGYAIGHSILVAVPAGILLAVLARDRGLGQIAVAFVLGYWTHILGDVLAPLRRGDPLGVDRVLWPVVAREPYPDDLGFSRGFVYVLEYVRDLGTADLSTLLVSHVGLAALTLALWLVDGAPGVRELLGHVGRVARMAIGR